MQSLWHVDYGPSTEIPQFDFSTKMYSAARCDRREGSSFEPYLHRDSYHQQLQQASGDRAFSIHRSTFIPVSVYLETSLSVNCPSADRLFKPFDDEIEQLSAQFERASSQREPAKAIKAATAAPLQKAILSWRIVTPPTSYCLHYDKYAVSYSLYCSIHDFGVPLVAYANRLTYIDAHLFEHAYSLLGARIIEYFREQRPSVVATSAPSASTIHSVAAPPPALADLLAAAQASLETLQVEKSSSIALPSQAPFAATHSAPCPTPLRPLAQKRPRAVRLHLDPKAVQLRRYADPQATKTTLLTRKDLTRKSI